MQRTKVNKLSSIVTYVILALLFLLIVGFIFQFTNGLNEDFKTFYVEYNGEKILTSESELSLQTDKDLRFDCKYVFSSLSGNKANGYTVKILPNITDKTQFDYTVGGKKYTYKDTGELTSAFNLKKYDDYFTLNIPFSMNMQMVLQTMYPDCNVIVPADVDIHNDCYFVLQVQSYNKKVTFNIKFKLSCCSLVLDNYSVIF